MTAYIGNDIMKTSYFVILCMITVFAGCSINGEYAKIKTTEIFSDYDGQKIQLSGTVAQEIWQHMIDAPETHPFINYICMGDEQVVVYSKDNIICDSTVKIFGVVKKVEGKSKKPGSKERQVEFHIVADKWECR